MTTTGLTYEVPGWTDGPVEIPSPQNEDERSVLTDVIESISIDSVEAEDSDFLLALRGVGQALQGVEWGVTPGMVQLHELVLDELNDIANLTRDGGDDSTRDNLWELYRLALEGRHYDPKRISEGRARLDKAVSGLGRLLDTADKQLRGFWADAGQNGGQS